MDARLFIALATVLLGVYIVDWLDARKARLLARAERARIERAVALLNQFSELRGR